MFAEKQKKLHIFQTCIFSFKNHLFKIQNKPWDVISGEVRYL